MYRELASRLITISAIEIRCPSMWRIRIAARVAPIAKTACQARLNGVVTTIKAGIDIKASASHITQGLSSQSVACH